MAGYGRPFVVGWQEADTEEALRAAYRAERDVDVRQRFHALWLLRSGERRMDEVARLVGTTYRTVQRWVAWYREGGLEAVRSHRMGGFGQTPRLTPEHQERLAAEVETGRFRNAVAIRAWVAETFGVTYTEGGMYSLLERLRCSPKVLIEQPPYAPELNPVERVFEHLHAGIEGMVYERIEDKVAAVEVILQELDADPERVKRLTGWSWIVTTLCALPQNHEP